MREQGARGLALACPRASAISVLFALVLVFGVFTPSNARAEEVRAEDRAPTRNETDATHGRLAGDVSFVLGAGATISPRSPRGTFDFRARYLDVIGLFATYEDAFGAERAEPERLVAGGLEVRPLFMGRWLKGMHSGSALLDLTLDSFGIELGAAFQKPRGAAFGSKPAMQAGLGIEVPLFARAEGLWLGAHGGARFGERAFDSGIVEGPLDRSLFLGLTLSFHLYVDAHVVDAGDRRVAGSGSR